MGSERTNREGTGEERRRNATRQSLKGKKREGSRKVPTNRENGRKKGNKRRERRKGRQKYETVNLKKELGVEGREAELGFVKSTDEGGTSTKRSV